jgi:hypothetical protein
MHRQFELRGSILLLVRACLFGVCKCTFVHGKYEFKPIAGCILWELYTGNPLFPGNTAIDMLHCINTVIDLPNIRASFASNAAAGLRAQLPPGGFVSLVLDGMPADFAELLASCLCAEPESRKSAEELLTLRYALPPNG